MPSPAGHIIAGVAIAWAAEAMGPLRRSVPAASRQGGSLPVVTPLVLACAALAVAPDLDILLSSHRTYTHSLGAVALVTMLSAVFGRVFGAPALATGLACGAAVAGHVLLDWLGRDSNTPRGVMALWPISTAYFYSGIDLFAEVSRRYWKPEEFIFKNALSVAREIAILGPVAAAAFWLRRRQAAGRGGPQRRRGTAESRIPNPESRT